MRTARILKGLISLTLVVLVAFLVTVAGSLMAVAGVSLAVGAVVAGGTVTQQGVTGGDTYSETTEYLDMRDVERKVMEYKPYNTPLLTLMSKVGGAPVSSWEAKYYAVDARGMETTITSGTTITDTYTTLTVANASIFTKYNTVFIPALAGTNYVNAGVSLVGIITAFPASNQITVKLLNPAAALAAATTFAFH